MQSGEFFRQFFSERGAFEPNTDGEATVLCPFPHDKGYESRPSAHVNIEKAIFHCKTCAAEGRFEHGGLSEVGFVASIHNISYEEAIRVMRLHIKSNEIEAESWGNAAGLLLENKRAMEYLTDKRGLTVDTVKTYQLAYIGAGIVYPIFVNGVLLDKRTYNMDWEDEKETNPGANIPKIKSEHGATGLLFPYDHWHKTNEPTLLVAGENDCLLARQNGFNALTKTNGEGGPFPKLFLTQFRGKRVYICYDCDAAGRKGSRADAFALKEAGAEVYVVDLGLPGTKDSKDISDFFLKEGGSSDQLLHLMQDALPYTSEMFQEDKNTEYPLVDLWNVPEGRYAGRRISSRVVLSGKYDQPMQAPTAIEWACDHPDPDNPVCMSCRMGGKSGWWMLEDRIKDVMELVDVTEQQQEKALKRFLGLPAKCPGVTKHIRARQAVYKVIFTPDVETEHILSGFRSVEQYAYTVGLNLEDGNKYRVFYRPYAHPLDGQRVFMLVDKVEDSDNALNAFRMTPEILSELQIFQGDPTEQMTDRAERMHGIPKMTFKPHSRIAHAVNLLYHSVLRFKFNGQEMKKGYPEILMVGESRTGKTETAQFFQEYVQLGNFIPIKGATTAGLLGGADKLPNGGHKISWGIIPQNNRGLVILDELSGTNREVVASLTSMRSELVATVPKIKRSMAPAATRLYWTSNPRVGKSGQSRHIKDFANGVEIILDLVGADEDVARFDICTVIAKSDCPVSSPLDVPEKQPYPAESYRHLILWAWSRKPDQIRWAEGVEAYVVHVANELNEKYDTDVKFFGAEAWKKLARIAVSCAACCFSHDGTGELVVVQKSHVDWASRYLADCYDNPIFRLGDYVRKTKAVSETNESVNTLVAAVCKTHPMVVKIMLEASGPVSNYNLQAVSGLEPQKYRELVNRMMQNFLINVSQEGMTATRRLRVAVDAYRENYTKTKMVPLSQEGGTLV